eukprot:jgi/Ulvmu1/10703/UM067_0029.1
MGDEAPATTRAGASESAHHPHAFFNDEGARLDLTPAPGLLLSPPVIGRSRLLSGMREQADTSAGVPLPIEPEALQAWLSHVQPDSRGESLPCTDAAAASTTCVHAPQRASQACEASASKPLSEAAWLPQAHSCGTALPLSLADHNVITQPHSDGSSMDQAAPPPQVRNESVAVWLPDPTGSAQQACQSALKAGVELTPVEQRAAAGEHMHAALQPPEGPLHAQHMQSPRPGKRRRDSACARPASSAVQGSDAPETHLGPAISAAEACALSSSQSVDQAVRLLRAADLLIDEVSAVEAHTALAALLMAEWREMQTYPHNIPPETTFKVLTQVPEDAALRILCAMHVPLATLLIYLAPTPFCPLALRALHPSIDTHATLRLPQLPPLRTSVTLRAIATLTHLHTLSLAGLPLSSPHLLQSTLSALPRLSSLSLRNTALAPAAAAALAAVLPQLPHLQSLDLSHNCLDPASPTLAATLSDLPALHTLQLTRTLSTSAAIRALGNALRKMSALTQLSVGAPEPLGRPRAAWGTHDSTSHDPAQHDGGAGDEHPINGLLHLTTALPHLPSLQWLDFGFELHGGDDSDAEHSISTALGTLHQLRHLGIHCRALFGLEKRITRRARCQRAVMLQALQRAGTFFDELTGLTSLDCHMHARGGAQLELGDMAVVLKRISRLTGLHSLRLPRAKILCKELADDVVQTLSQFTALTHVDCRIGYSGGGAFVAEFTQSLVSLPSVQSVTGLWRPRYRGHLDHIVPASCGAAQAVATAATAGKDVKLAFAAGISRFSSVEYRSHEMLLMLPLLKRFDVSIQAPVRTRAVEEALAHATAVTQLSIELHGLVVSSSDLDTVPGSDAIDGPPEPVWGDPWRGILHACGQLTQLRILRLCINGRGRHGDAVRHDTYPCRASLARTAARTVEALQHAQLTALHLTCGSQCWGLLLPGVLVSCRGLSRLRCLFIQVFDDQPPHRQDPPPIVACGPEYDSWRERARARLQPVHIADPDFAALGALIVLQHLTIIDRWDDDITSLIQVALPQLTLLQSLSLFAKPGVVEAPTLASCVREHLVSLRCLHVSGEALGSEGVRQLRAGVGSSVRVHWCACNASRDFLNDSDSEEDGP